MNDKVYVAKLGKTVGLEGYLRLFIDCDFPQQFKKGAIFTTNRNLNLKIQGYSSSRQIVKFENYDGNAAKELTNQQLFVSFEDTRQNCSLGENQYFWFDLIDCKVSENGKILGFVEDVHRLPLNDYLQICTHKELVKQKLPNTFLIPYVVGNYIIKVDIPSKIINVKNCYEILENS